MNQSNETPTQNTQQKNIALFKVYSLYRVALCFALLTTFLLSSDELLIGTLKPDQFFYVTCGYTLINLLALAIILPRKTALNNQALFANIIFDIGIITIIVDASNGVTSGLGILLVVIVASGSIMLTGQLAILSAALASIAIIIDTSLLINDGHLKSSSFLSAGLLGIILFITSLLIQNLAQRIRGAQTIAEQRLFKPI